MIREDLVWEPSEDELTELMANSEPIRIDPVRQAAFAQKMRQRCELARQDQPLLQRARRLLTEYLDDLTRPFAEMTFVNFLELLRRDLGIDDERLARVFLASPALFAELKEPYVYDIHGLANLLGGLGMDPCDFETSMRIPDRIEHWDLAPLTWITNPEPPTTYLNRPHWLYQLEEVLHRRQMELAS